MTSDDELEEQWLIMPINPEPWAIGPVGYGRRNGKMSAYVGQNAQLNAYKETIAEAAREIWGPRPPLEGPVRLALYFWRHRAEYTTPQARTHRKHEADATNMQKATEDALQGIAFKNDRDNLCVFSQIMEQSADTMPLVIAHVGVGSEPFESYEIPGWVLDEAQYLRNKAALPPTLSDNSWG